MCPFEGIEVNSGADKAALDQAAEDPKFGERPCGNITLNGDGVGLEDPRDQSRPVWAATSIVTEAFTDLAATRTATTRRTEF